MAAVLAALSIAAIAFFFHQGTILYYGDATAHINIARRIFDSRTPGWSQIGTVWLPLPHILMLPFVGVDWLWRTGLAGSIPAGACFVAAGVFLFLAVRRVFDGAAAAAACLAFALNPNLLYLQAVPMTEVVFMASLAATLYFTVRFRQTQGRGAVLGAAVAATLGTLARYEGWIVLPLAALYFLIAAREKRRATAMLFCGIAAIGPVFWVAHNWFYFGNPLEFYNGVGSAKVMNAAGYPGNHDWRTAAKYLTQAIRLCVGTPLEYLAIAGAAIALMRRSVWPLLLLASTPLFYWMSMHSGGTPIFVPQLWPFSYYNTRYGLSALPVLAFAAGALATLAPGRIRKLAAALVVLAAVSPWLGYPRMENWVCWKESQVNSEARRTWTREAADYLRANYRAGDGVLTTFGDVAGIYQQAGIPLRETLSECNWRKWQAITEVSYPQPREKWAVALQGDLVARTVARAAGAGARYDLVKTVIAKGAPPVEIYRRQP
ncbi:MAG: glycosyltransferase family 39 protein [Acidobacteriota bacterium]